MSLYWSDWAAMTDTVSVGQIVRFFLGKIFDLLINIIMKFALVSFQHSFSHSHRHHTQHRAVLL